MKKLVIGLFLMLCLSLPVFGATTGNIDLSGVVPSVLSVTSNASLYTFKSAGVSEEVVATLNVKSNTKSTYTITFTSVNSFKLVTSGVTTVWNYSLSLYDGANKITPSSGYTYVFTSKTPKGGKDFLLKITYDPEASADGGGWLEAGSYTDTMTFTVTTP